MKRRHYLYMRPNHQINGMNKLFLSERNVRIKKTYCTAPDKITQ